MFRIYFFIGIFLCSNFISAQMLQPKADAPAMVTIGKARFTILTDRLIRMEWNENATFEDRASFVVVNRKLPMVSFTKKEDTDWLTIQTKELTMTYKKGAPFSKDNLSITFDLNGKAIVWQPDLEDKANLGGTARTLDGCKGGKDWNGNPVDLGQGIISRSGWFLLDDSQSFLLDNSDWAWVNTAPAALRQDWYFFGYGNNYKQALKDYTSIAGKIPMVPKFALGYWWSRYWLYSDPELKKLVGDFKTYDIPIDVLVIDMDWHETFGGLTIAGKPEMDETGHWLGWTGYTWNKSYFPNPAKFLKWTDDNHLKTALNLHPASGIAPMEDVYADFAKAYNVDPKEKKYIPYKMDEKKWAKTYFDIVLQPMEKMGVDFWWLDWQQEPESFYTKGLSNIWWLNYTFFTDMERRGQKRPLLFHRWGGMGNHRYQIGFSGDDKIDWGSLKYQTYFTPTASNVGYGYWSHDIGGHASSELDANAELYVRWLQFGVFSPILRTHSAKISSIERRFWKYPEQFKTMNDLIHLRYSLAPYIYTAARHAYDEGISICRPMYYDYPKQEEAYEFKYQYFFGNDLLVAPISDAVTNESGLVSQKIWLPEGNWYEWHSGAMVKGNQTINRNFAINEIPLYAKAGSIIPMYPKIQNLQQQVSDWVINIVPGKDGETTVYEDDDTTNAYKNAVYATTKILQKSENTIQKISIQPRQGSYPDMYSRRTYEVKLLTSFPLKKLTVNGEEYLYSEQKSPKTWQYDGNNLSVIISIPSVAVSKTVTIEVEKDPKYMGKENILYTKAMTFRRISSILEKTKIEVARSNWWAFIPKSILNAEQAPIKIGYQPEVILDILNEFDSDYETMKKSLLENQDARKEVTQKLVNYLEY